MRVLFLFLVLFPLYGLAQTCPDSDEVGAKVSHTYLSGVKAFVCGFEDEDPDKKTPKKKKLLNEFVVYSQVTDARPVKIFSAGASDNYWVSSDAKRGLSFEELMLLGNKLQPISASFIECENEVCKRSKETCILKRPRTKYPDIIRQIHRKRTNKISALSYIG